MGEETGLQIVGIDIADREETHVHTIDMWFSKRRNVWLVERLNADGHVVGAIHRCASADDARACVQEWLRAHAETHLLAPEERKVVRQRLAKPDPREKRRAA